MAVFGSDALTKVFLVAAGVGLNQTVSTAVMKNLNSMVVAIEKHGVSVGLHQPYELAAFAPQMAHESGGFRYDREVWGPTPTQTRYQGRKDLGNIFPGDGSKFRGYTAVQITGRAAVPGDASAVVLNVTVTEPDGPGFVTVYPCGGDIPTASSINYGAGSTVANLVVAKLGAGGQVCLYSNRATHLVVDIAGYFPQITTYHSLVPARVLETRPGESTIDGQFSGAGLREAGETALRRHLDAQVGITHRVLTEGPRLGRTEQFTEVAFASDQPEGALMDLRIRGHDGSRLVA